MENYLHQIALPQHLREETWATSFLELDGHDRVHFETWIEAQHERWVEQELECWDDESPLLADSVEDFDVLAERDHFRAELQQQWSDEVYWTCAERYLTEVASERS